MSEENPCDGCEDIGSDYCQTFCLFRCDYDEEDFIVEDDEEGDEK